MWVPVIEVKRLETTGLSEGEKIATETSNVSLSVFFGVMINETWLTKLAQWTS